ncbi:MAG: hypothetical protein PHU03_01610 [Syntrophales bacterium]|nr:hypothetical protein [Syntrophales bacterium]
MELKNREGAPLGKMTEGIVNESRPDGTQQEIKEWLALASYMKSFPDRTGDGLPDIPLRYAVPEGRIVAEPSWNPVDMVRGGTIITHAFLALAILILLTPALIVKIIRKRRRRAMKLRFY